jgi:hypothetical protein
MTLIKQIYADFFFLLKGCALEQKDTLISINPCIRELKSSLLLFCERICEAKSLFHLFQKKVQSCRLNLNFFDNPRCYNSSLNADP